MHWLLSAARKAGWPAEQPLCEFFGAEVGRSGEEASFKVKLAS